MSTPADHPFQRRASHWRLRTRTLTLGRQPLLMGILNLTPDSFSDGGRYFHPEAAVAHGIELIEQGADILDVGGQSTRPYSTPVDVDEELHRVMPALELLCPQSPIPISIDTASARVAREALAAGVEMINDVTGLEGDSAMPAVASETLAGVCAMHMQGTPQTMQDDPQYDDVVDDIYTYLKHRRNNLTAAGIDMERICLDPGIGFGKSHEHNLTLLANCWRFHELNCPILVGHSRKGFIAKVTGADSADRTAGTLGVALSLARQGVQIIRVHDIQPLRHALLLFEAAGGLEQFG